MLLVNNCDLDIIDK